MQNLPAPATSHPAVPRGVRRAATVGAEVTAAAALWLATSAALSSAAWADGGTNVAGSQRAPKWPVIQTIGIFAGIPLAVAVIIVALVMAGPIRRSGGSGGTAVFSGPHAGPVDAGVAPATHTDVPDGPVPAAEERPAQGGAGATW